MAELFGQYRTRIDSDPSPDAKRVGAAQVILECNKVLEVAQYYSAHT